MTQRDQQGVPLGLFGALGPEEFLEQHWQKQPLLVRGALPGFAAPATRSELIALACRETIPSRLITAPVAERDWVVRRGPFQPGDFDGLSDEGWTVLIQEADRHEASFARLLDLFRFLPNWRLDDVMVSYATDGGGVGPHIDRYDVFLLQTAGRRRWRIDTRAVEDERLRPGIELPVLAEFTPDQEWLLDPGDLLYLPPRIAHEGTAVGTCVTCSIGLRTPDPRELLAGFLRQLAPSAFDRIRYADPGLRLAERLGEIPTEARRRLRDGASQLLAAGGEFDRWIGRFVTQPLRGGAPGAGTACTVDELWDRLEHGDVLRRSAPAHFAWLRDEQGRIQLCVGGESYALDPSAEADAELLCGRGPLDDISLRPLLAQPTRVGLLLDLLLRGYLTFDRG